MRDRRYLSHLRVSDKTRGETLARVEKRIFIAFYSIRKLMDADKLTTAYLSHKLDISWHPNVAAVDKMNWHKIGEKYDLSIKKHEQRDLRWISNQIIHSYVFMPAYGETGAFDGVFLASDKEKNKRVFFFPRKLILDILKLVGSDDPAISFSTRRDDGDWAVKNW